MACLSNCNLEESKADWWKSNIEFLKTCQMINLTLLDVRNHDEQWLKLESELEDIRIYGDNDDWLVHIRADLNPNDKG